MSNKPVQEEQFWRGRLRSAKEHGDVRYSVYLTSRDDWRHLNQTHKDIIDKLIKPEDNVLDAGCGYGRASEWIENYTGIDLSPDLIEHAKRMYPDKDFIVGSLKQLPYQDNEFDWSICISIKAMIIGNCGKEEWDIMLKELKRVAKKVLVLEYTNPQDHEVL